MDREIQRQLIISGASTAGTIAGLVIANKTGWNKTLTMAGGAFVGLMAGVAFGLIDEGNKADEN